MPERSKEPLILVISQVYVPDPASVGQHMADAAEALVERGYAVRVLTSARGYENPQVRYAPRERRGGVEIVRLPLSSFGKRTILHRLLGQALFLLQTVVRGVFAPRLAAVLVSTSPPMGSVAALIISFLRGVPIKFWLMDMNPDQLIALGKVGPTSLPARVFRTLNRRLFARAADVVVLDRFMAARVGEQYRPTGRMEVLPPWPHESALEPVEHTANPFRREHELGDKIVVMYSGNHSLASPLTTLVQAALALQEDPRFVFLFIGGGHGKREIDEAISVHRPVNIRSLPYQPLEQIRFSLSAGDVHVVALGNDMVGIIHPCKIYGAMAVGRPVLLLGPRPSHASDILDEYDIGWQVAHGDVPGMIRALQAVADTPREQLRQMGDRARAAVDDRFSKEALCSQFVDAVVRDLPSAPASATAVDPRRLECG